MDFGFGLLLWTEDDSGLPTGPLTITKIMLIMFSLNMLDSSVFSLMLSTCAGKRGHTKSFLLFEFSCYRPPSCLQVVCGLGESKFLFPFSI